MIKVLIPNNNINERKYIIDVLLGEFLGLDYNINIEIKDIKNYKIILDNGNKLIIEDNFFNKFSKELKYLNKKNIPQKIEFGKNEFILENDIPIIYGNDKVEFKNNQIICGIDVFASSFFMLSRWEEYVNKTRDKHNRFPAYASLAYKNNFLNRPIVNEYVEMLWNMLKKLGINPERRKRKFEFVLTHDVDDILLFRNYTDLIRRVGGDLIRRKNPLLAIKTSCDYIQVRLDKKNDPYDTFDWLMDMSESVGIKSYFFFMAKGNTGYDNRYNSNSLFVKELVKKIKKRGHYIGIHPTYDAYNDFEQLKKEKEELEKNLETKITFGREHYLRFEVPTTWQIWEDNDMVWDSTCGYADREGFRCGTSDEYNVFNILTRTKLNLKERPLLIMDTTFLNTQFSEVEIFIIIKNAKKYNSLITLLFHNSNFYNTRIENLYYKICKKAFNK